MVSRCEPFDTLDHSSDQIFAGLDVTCFLVYLPGNHIYPCGGLFVEHRQSCHRSVVQTVTLGHPSSNYHRWSPLEVHQDLFLCL